ncbi:restriction endonuclease subunit S [Sphingobacterium oryzagri]|uniref:Restriction endonuclease subunit S n=1 Tax=Sphingobacterium oryzagri TaxID=3025669 RepID=A0ABY7WL97_9SPHI|nr:restriction endonuclease subunit S [Sphingobacterium sp. KACC 22765]WDF70367.1 restriction endonuclease subunit S [Sphingobacterium sp. KACC 22765]
MENRGWREYKLEEVMTITSSKRIFYEEYVQTGVPFYRSKEVIDLFNRRDIQTELFISEKKFDEIKNKFGVPSEDDILLTSVGSLGIPYLVTNSDKFYFKDGNLTWLKDIDKNILHPIFIYIWITSQIGKQKLEEISIGSTQAALTISGLKSIEITLPPLPEQKAIASVLSSLDDKIDLLHQQNQTLEALGESLFRQWFIEEAKEDWEEDTLDNILTVKGGTTPSTSESSYWNGTINWTSPRDITNLSGIYLFDTERKITEVGLSRISSGLLPKGTLLMTSRAPVGVLAFSEVPIAINQGYIAILDNKGYSKEFIYLWLKTNIDLVHSFSNGSTFMEISKSSFKSIQLLLPSKEIINEFDLIVKRYFEKIKANSKQIQILSNLRDTLLPKLMSGEIRVKH